MTRTPPDRLLRALAGRLVDEDASFRTASLEAAERLERCATGPREAV